MGTFGLTVHHDSGGKRIELECQHQNGLLYIVPSKASWVCSEDFLHAHSLAGLFTQLIALDDPEVKQLMQKWGVYFRERPLAMANEKSSNQD